MSSFIFSSRPRLFVLAVVAAVLGLGVAGLAAAAYFTATGDLLDEARVAEIQRDGGPGCTYSSLATNNHAAFKYAAYAGRQPKIVALGSSRVLEFNGRLFSQPFYNLGRTMSSLADGHTALREMIRSGKPDIVLLGIDYWLFTSSHRTSISGAGTLGRVDPVSPSQLLKLVGSVIHRPELMVGADRLLNGPDCPLGIASIAYHSGFDADGFYYYGQRLMLPQADFDDYVFRDSLRRVRSGARRFEHGETPDIDRVRELAALVETFRREGIKVVPFLPPVAPTVFAEMAKAGGYGYVAKLREALIQEGLDVHDFHDPRSLDLVDCEFVDGNHGGDVAYARLLGELARREPGLAGYLDIAEVRRVGGMAGRAAVYFEETFGVPESDFLGLGCVK